MKLKAYNGKIIHKRFRFPTKSNFDLKKIFEIFFYSCKKIRCASHVPLYIFLSHSTTYLICIYAIHQLHNIRCIIQNARNLYDFWFLEISLLLFCQGCFFVTIPYLPMNNPMNNTQLEGKFNFVCTTFAWYTFLVDPSGLILLLLSSLK